MADVEKRQEEGKVKEAKAEVTGLPDPTRSESASSLGTTRGRNGH